jgi:8-oxo-dGTP pyrophosphatase MutT (NUDIX family)
MTRIEQSYGVCLFEGNIAPDRRVLLVQHIHENWGFPKGHPQPGETPQDTAVRELREETGISAVQLCTDTVEESYTYMRAEDGLLRAKKVTYFLATIKQAQPPKILDSELLDAAWVQFSDAQKRIIHGAQNQVLIGLHDYFTH